MSKIKDIVETIKKVCATVVNVAVFLTGRFLAFLVFGGWMIFALCHSFFGFPSKNAIIILSIPVLIFICFIIIFETHTWIRQHFCSHKWECVGGSDCHRRCIKCGKDENTCPDYSSYRGYRGF